jgi:hypothetical protein
MFNQSINVTPVAMKLKKLMPAMLTAAAKFTASHRSMFAAP